MSLKSTNQREEHDEPGRPDVLTLATTVRNARGKNVITGVALVQLPA